MKTKILVVFSLFFFGQCKVPVPLETVKEIDLEKYVGKWHEIARYPNRFQTDCQCSTAEYAISNKGYVTVTNRCKKNNKEEVATGKAFLVKGSNNTKLRVQFQWPFKGNYWIIDCAPDYSYAVVSEPSRKYLWILSRTPKLDKSIYTEILERLKQQKFDTGKLLKSTVDCK